MKKALLLVILSAVLALTACTGETPSTDQGAIDNPAPAGDSDIVPARPTIQLNAGNEVYDGVSGAYCWFQSVNDIQCELGPVDPQPETTVQVEQGDILTFTISSEDGAPTALRATLLDDTTGDDAPAVIELDSDLAADYEVDLDAGLHRISVVAEFTATDTDTNFITTVFAVEVAESMAMAPTATDEPEPTDEPTEEPTEVPATEEPEATEEPTAPPTEEPTATDVPPTATATSRPTQAPATATSRPSPSPVPPTASLAMPVVEAPEVVMVKGSSVYSPVGVTYCPTEADTCEPITGEAPDQQIALMAGDTVRIDLADGGPSQMEFVLTNTGQTEEFDRLALRGNTLALYTIPVEAGDYLLAIETTWPDATATYYFRLQITG